MDNPLKLFASLTKDYERRFLPEPRQPLENDWWKALQFFFDRVFYQGRRDDISAEVERRVIRVLSKYFSNEVIRDSEFERLKKENWKEVSQELRKTIGKGKMGKQRDIELTISTIKFVSSLQDKNLINYCIS